MSEANPSNRADVLFQEQQQRTFRETDRLFAWLMIFQWFAGIAAALWISPRTWAGQFSQVHIHVWAAIFLGGLISAPGIILAFTSPGQKLTRYVISVCQMLTSALLIHLTGGRIETHFHVFGSLAFLAFYRDWKVLVPATIVVAFDHWARGIFWPQSVYGILAVSPWRWLEHAGWVLFEDLFLIVSCLRSTEEMKRTAERAAALEMTNQIIETKVRDKTRDLVEANQQLEIQIKQREKLEKAMIQSEKMAAVGQLAGGVAHEINNPLGVILGFAQGIAKRVQPGDPFEMPLKSIEREAVRCKQLVRDLLTFSRTTKLEKEMIDLNETVEAALTLILAQIKVKSNVEMIKSFQNNLPQNCANHVQIQQVVINLCNNAMDAMPNGGKMTIRTKKCRWRNQDANQIEIQDSGEGIPKEIQPKIFDPFFTTKEVGKGTGLGLALVYEIVQKHEGEIQLESEVGKGSLFRIILPSANHSH